MFNLIFGIIVLVLGLSTIYIRVVGKEDKWLGKIVYFKRVWGEKFGTILHILAYTVAPIITGIMLIISYFLGIDI